MIGSAPAWPRQSRTARAVSRASVPLTSAMLNSSVTPTSVTNSVDGKPSSTGAGDMPPRQHADDQRQRERQHADVDRRRAAQRDGEHERRDRDPGEAHRGRGLAVRARRGQRPHERRDVGELLEAVDELEHLVDGGRRQHERRAVAELLVAARRA